MRTMPITCKSLMALALILGLTTVGSLGALFAEAQETQSQQDLSRSDLETFAKAFMQVTRIYNVYEHRITESTEADQAKAWHQKANQEMAQAVQDHGLSIEDYNDIYQMIENDPGLQKRFQNMLGQHNQ